MATFDDFRLCQTAEYDYFKPERLELEQLFENGIFVAMYSLKKKIGDKQAAAVPLMVAEIDGTEVACKIFLGKQKLSHTALKFTMTPNNFIEAKDLAIEISAVEQGYIRDYREEVDGILPEDKIANEMENPLLAGVGTR